MLKTRAFLLPKKVYVQRHKKIKTSLKNRCIPRSAKEFNVFVHVTSENYAQALQFYRTARKLISKPIDQHQSPSELVNYAIIILIQKEFIIVSTEFQQIKKFLIPFIGGGYC